MLSLPDPQNANAQKLKVVGEVKVPWVREHKLGLRVTRSSWLRRVVAQTISYTLDLGCAYGSITNHDETIFSRQVQVGSTWQVEYSPVIKSSDGYAPPDQSTAPVLTLNQCLLALAMIAEVQGPIINPTPQSQWIRRF